MSAKTVGPYIIFVCFSLSHVLLFLLTIKNIDVEMKWLPVFICSLSLLLLHIARFVSASYGHGLASAQSQVPHSWKDHTSTVAFFPGHSCLS